MKFAFLHKNFQQLPLEHKVICVGSFATMLLCFFPWYSESPSYGEGLWQNGFQGPIFLIGSLIFGLGFLVFLYFADVLWEKRIWKYRGAMAPIFFAISLQQLLLAILAWSVLQSIASVSFSAEIRFGIFLIFLMQFASMVSSILRMKNTHKQAVRDFFQPMDPEKKTVTPPPSPEKMENKNQSLL